MNEFMKIFFGGEYTKSEKVIYGVVAPMVFIVIAILASALE